MNVDLQKKLERFCAYQERCKQDVLRKIADLRRKEEINGKDIEEAISYLQEENFINENRYARLFAVSKLRQKQWGKYKIKAHLRAKNISQEDIQEALNAINESEYENIKQKLMEKKGEQAARVHGF